MPESTADRGARNFHDHFSTGADAYRNARPHGPRELLDFLLARTPSRRLAWDCGTGTGQTARYLAPHFDRVLASDAGPALVARIEPARVEPETPIRPLVALAEAAPLAEASVDLCTVSQALHWFDLELFYAEIRRVVRAGGFLAAWTYHLPRIAPAIDRHLDRLAHQTLARDWPPERSRVEDRYRSMPFPFDELKAPEFTIERIWSRRQLLAYLGTWSALGRYRHRTGVDPLPELDRALAPHWPGSATVTWPVTLRLGRIDSRGS